jgi:hypothetical protein
MAIMDGRNTETVVLRKRTALSPTTPRTRAERDFGLRLARTPNKSPSFVVSGKMDLRFYLTIHCLNYLLQSQWLPNDLQMA